MMTNPRYVVLENICVKHSNCSLILFIAFIKMFHQPKF